MKKGLCLAVCTALLAALTACGGNTASGGSAGAPAAPSGTEGTTAEAPSGTEETAAAATTAAAAAQAETGWPRDAFFDDGNNNVLTILYLEGEDIQSPGWNVGCMLGEDSWGGMLPLEGDALHGSLESFEDKDPLTVTITAEGEKGALLETESGETWHFTETEIPDATIFVTINTEGFGRIAYTEGEETPEIDPDYPFQSAQINLAEPATHTFAAAPEPGNFFVKWTKNGEDFSTEPVVTVLLEESADYIAVFEEDPDWQNPVMNFVGNYQCDRASAKVECMGFDEAVVTVDWANSAEELARWCLVGHLDTETLTINYTGGTKNIVHYDANGEEDIQDPEYMDGTGTITFNEDGTFTWHEEQPETREDMVFEWVPVTEE